MRWGGQCDATNRQRAYIFTRTCAYFRTRKQNAKLKWKNAAPCCLRSLLPLLHLYLFDFEYSSIAFDWFTFIPEDSAFKGKLESLNSLINASMSQCWWKVYFLSFLITSFFVTSRRFKKIYPIALWYKIFYVFKVFSQATLNKIIKLTKVLDVTWL